MCASATSCCGVSVWMGLGLGGVCGEMGGRAYSNVGPEEDTAVGESLLAFTADKVQCALNPFVSPLLHRRILFLPTPPQK